MHQNIEKRIFAGLTAALVMCVVMFGAGLRQVTNVAESPGFGIVVAAGCVACLLLAAMAWLLARHEWKGRERMRQALHDAAGFRELFDDAPVAYHELDTEGRMVRVNKTELALLGYSLEEMVGRHVWEFCVETISKEMVAEKLKGAGNVSEAFQRHYRRKDGVAIPVLVRDRLIRDASGTVCGIRTTMQDISVLKKTEESLRSAEENYRKIFENAIEGIFQIHPEGRYLNVNPALTSILGYLSPTELMGSVTDIAKQVYVEPDRFAEF